MIEQKDLRREVVVLRKCMRCAIFCVMLCDCVYSLPTFINRARDRAFAIRASVGLCKCMGQLCDSLRQQEIVVGSNKEMFFSDSFFNFPTNITAFFFLFVLLSPNHDHIVHYVKIVLVLESRTLIRIKIYLFIKK